MKRSADIAIVGGGILGLAHAYMAIREGYRVVLFERDQFPVSASIRNFGLIWPVGQSAGEDLDMALTSRKHWQEVAQEAGFWLHDNGSLHLAYHEDEWEVLREFLSINSGHYSCELLQPTEVLERSPMVRKEGLIGALFSSTESTVYSRDAVQQILEWLEKSKGLIVRRGYTVTDVQLPLIKTSMENWAVKKVIICNGADFETLYPGEFEKLGFIKCKLQMLRARVPAYFKSPSLCAGLTLRHYNAFAKCPSLPKLSERYDKLNWLYKEYGIHVLVSQNPDGDLIIGDSHEYGDTFTPFDKEEINQQILEYLNTFTDLPHLEVIERWNGIYAKVPGQTKVIIEPEPNVTIVNGVGGAGMTLSFGLAERVLKYIV